MALRSKACPALLVLIAAVAGAQPFEFRAEQKRLWRDRQVTVRVDADGMEAMNRHWPWDDVQQLTLTATELRVLTYADAKLMAGRDREWTLEKLPPGQAAALYPFLRERLQSRLVAAIAVRPAAVLWEAKAKLRSAFGGSEGTLIWSTDTVVWHSPERDQSRTWRIEDIEGVSSGDASELTLTTSERRGVWRGGPSDFHFQLKRPMPEERYQSIWRQVQRNRGLDILQ